MENQLSDVQGEDSPEVEALHTALDSLPDHYQAPLRMHFFVGLDPLETAQALGVPAWTIRKQLERGLERLRDKLGRAGFAVTSAGLLSLFASLPTYAAPASLKANLAAVASERLAAAGHQVSHRLLTAKKVSSLATGSGIFKAAVVSVLAVAATVTLSKQRDTAPMPAIAAPVPVATMDPDNGLVGHWNLDETRGTTAADSSGNGFDGTLQNYSTPSWIAGKIGGALDFDGESNVVSLGSPTALTNLTRFTIAAWIMPRGLGHGSLGRIIDKRAASAGWTLFLETDGLLDFKQIFSGESGTWKTSTNSVTLGAWQHVALTYDNSSAANRPVFYINGILAATTVETAPSGSVNSDIGVPLAIGNAINRELGRAFDGVIDDVRIYNRILNASEIQALVVRNTSPRK